MKIIGVGGTNGAGKDSLGEMLAERHGYLNVTATGLFVVELNKRGWPIDRKHKSKLSAIWRREYGMSAVVDMAVEQFKKEKPGAYKGLVVGSLRHPGEADRVHELGGTVVWIDADPRVRYDRIQKNLHERVGTHAEEGVTFEEFLADEEREMHPEGDEATLHVSAVKERADVFIDNDGNSVEAFKDAAEKALGLSKE